MAEQWLGGSSSVLRREVPTISNTAPPAVYLRCKCTVNTFRNSVASGERARTCIPTSRIRPSPLHRFISLGRGRRWGKEGRKEGIVDDPPFILHLGTPVWQRAAKGNGRYHLSAPRTRYESQRSNHSDVIRETTGEETQKNEKLRGEAFKRLRNGTLYVYRSRENSSRRGESESSRGRRFDFRLERLCRFAHRYDNNDDPLRSRRLCLLLIYRSCELRTRACRIYKGFGLDDTARHCQWQTVSVTAGLRYLVASAASKGEIIHSAAR